jgi:hypothetical protein
MVKACVVVNATLPVLVSVEVKTALVVPTAWLVNTRGLGEIETLEIGGVVLLVKLQVSAETACP